jgi:hypothetical protein
MGQRKSVSGETTMSSKEPKVFSPDWRISRTKPEPKQGRITFQFDPNYWTCDKFPHSATPAQREVLCWLWLRRKQLSSPPIMILVSNPEPDDRSWEKYWGDLGASYEVSYERSLVLVTFLESEAQRGLTLYFCHTAEWHKVGCSGYHDPERKCMRIKWA